MDFFKTRRESVLFIEGEQNMCLQNIPLWHVDYLELKTINQDLTDAVRAVYLPFH